MRLSSSKFREGDVVTTVNKSKLKESGMVSGTIVVLTDNAALVLDKEGLIHNAVLHEICEYQNLGE